MLLPAGSLLCASACSNGLVEIKPLVAAEQTPDAGEGKAGTGGGGAGGSFGRGGPGGGSGGGSGSDRPGERGAAGASARMLPTPCDAYLEPDISNALRDAFNDALVAGNLCPREATGLRRALVDDLDLQWQANAATCLTTPSGGNWFHVPRSTMMGWILSDTSSLEEAKKKLLDREALAPLCDEAARTNFRSIAVAYGTTTWTVFISPNSPEDTRRGDM